MWSSFWSKLSSQWLREAVLHQDVKASNVIIDSDYTARLGDFGLARTLQNDGRDHHSTKVIAAIPGFIALECFHTSRASAEPDVYSFGVFSLEVACGRRPRFNPRNFENGMVDWVWDLCGKVRVFDAVDPQLTGEFDEEQMGCMQGLALACCHPNPNERPSMRVGLQVLNGEAPPLSLPLRNRLLCGL